MKTTRDGDVTVSTTLHLNLLGTEFSVVTPDDRWRDLVSQLWAPFLVQASHVDYGFHIVADGDGWLLTSSEGGPIRSEDPWIILHSLRNAMSSFALRDSTGIVGLHASVVAEGTDALILAGPPLAGKTTLMLELLSRGWSYVSDDLAAISVASSNLRPFPKPVHVREPAVWERYEPRWRVARWLPRPVLTGLIPSEALGPPAAQELRPRYLVFPRFSPAEEPGLKALSPGWAAARCAENCQTSTPPKATALTVLARLARLVRSTEICYGSSSEALDLLSSWMVSMPREAAREGSPHERS